MGLRVAVLGATGLVGRTILGLLEEREFPVDRLLPLASAASAGRRLAFRGVELPVEEALPESFEGIDLVIASAGGAVSQRLLPEAARRGAVCVDNSSAFRMEADVPLVVPEVNPGRAFEHGPRRIVANPNCSTIQLVLALEPLRERFGLERVIVSTYQSASGAGSAGIDELLSDSVAALEEREQRAEVFPAGLAFNVIPAIDLPLPDGDTREEWKMRVETPKILGVELPVHATCVRVPTLVGHGEAVWVETSRPVDIEEARACLDAAPGLELHDDLPAGRYPTPRDTAGRDAVRVGRLRRDPTIPNGLALWIVSDNVRKGAALNAVQVAELLASRLDIA